MRSVLALTGLNLIRLYRRLFLLLAAAAAFAMLSYPLAAGAAGLFQRDDVSGISIAVAGEAEESRALADFAGNLKDISAYCSFLAADMDAAMDMLEKGEVTAVLELPDDFVNSILAGENESARLHVDENRPAESLLTIYAGQCAADMLSAAQGGIYAVLDALKAAGEYDESSVLEINLEYIRFTLARGDMYAREAVSPTGAVPLGEHYTASLLLWLLLTAGTVYHPVLSTRQGGWRRRLRAAGYSGVHWALGAMLPVLMGQALLAGAVCAFAGKFDALCALSLAVFAAGTGAFIGAASPGEASCGGLIFVVSVATVFLAGGIVPPLLLPEFIRDGAVHAAAAELLGCVRGQFSALPLLVGAALLAAAFCLLRGSFGREERV